MGGAYTKHGTYGMCLEILLGESEDIGQDKTMDCEVDLKNKKSQAVD
jgi:hypothetical protein